MRRRRDNFLPWVQLLTDVVALYCLLWFCFWFRFESGWVSTVRGVPFVETYFRTYHFSVLIVVLFLRQYGLYKPLNFATFSQEATNIFKAIIVSMIVLSAMTFFYRSVSFSRVFMALSGIIVAIGLCISRYVLNLAVMWLDQRRGRLRNILIVGCEESARKLVRFYKMNPHFRTRVTAFLDHTWPVGSKVDGVEVVGRPGELAEYIRTHQQIHEVILASPGMSMDDVLLMIYECEKSMVSFQWIADIFGLVASRMNVSYLAGTPLLSFSNSPLTDWEKRLVKRLMDILLSAIALVALIPLYLVLALLIKWDSKGPVFYRQERVGEDGRRFDLFKFRTMAVDAEADSGPVWTKENDPRRTRFGATLRRLNLDELPQFWNVLVGDMSLVGPRPERPHFVSQFTEVIPRYMARHSIKSGLTGWAQVNGLRGNTSIEERTKYDLYYLENWSIGFDIQILIKTGLSIFKSPNAY